MPTYEYRCKNGHQFEVVQRMSDDPVTVCEVCGAPVDRVFHPVAVHFKGSGFYSTDYGRGGGAGADSGSKDESKKETAASETAGSKSESKSSSESSTKDTSSGS